jgi:uncharacterized protein (DUF1810 family)
MRMLADTIDNFDGRRRQRYLTPPFLGARLVECTRAMLAAVGSVHAILGSPDDLKFRFSMTLFRTADAGPLYREAPPRFFDGEDDPLTVQRP